MKRQIITVFGILFLALTSCTKEGCIYSNANNYDPDAKEDDGSCQFDGTVTTSIGFTDQNNLQDDGVAIIEVYVDNSYAGLINVDDYSVSQSSSCMATQNAPKAVSWTGETSQSYFVDYKNQATGLSIFSTDVVVFANNCGYVDFSY